MNLKSSSDAWLRSIEAALPPGEDCSIIVASRSGTQYITLNSACIGSHLEGIRLRQRRWLRALAFFAIAVVSVLVTFRAYWLQLNDALVQKTVALESLTEQVVAIEGSVPLAIRELAGGSSDEPELLLVAVQSALVAYRDLMDFYVEITRDVFTDQTDSVKAALAKVGVDGLDLQPDETEGYAVGGIREDRVVSALLDLHVSNEIAELLNLAQNQQVLLRKLPTSLPLDEARVTSRFGLRRHPITTRNQMHRGIDLTTAAGRDIRPAAEGVVAFAGRNKTYGNYVIIKHADDIRTLYAHLDRVHVAKGEVVTGNTVLGVMGNTGRSSAPHLHFEVHANGKHVDPMRIMELAQYVR